LAIAEALGNCARVHGNCTTGITRKGLLGLSGLWIICLVLGAPMARADSVSALAGAATVGGYYNQCAKDTVSVGGAGFVSASTGIIPCTDIFGDTTSDSASGSWLTGDLSATGSVSTAIDSGFGAMPGGNVTLEDIGTITLPVGMSSATVTFGATGVSATASAPTPISGGGQAGAGITLSMLDGAVAYSGCIGNLTGSNCSGLDASPSISGTVYNGESLELMVQVGATAYAFSGGTGAASITVDPLYLDLPAGVTFSSYTTVPGFLGGQATPIPEPSSLLLLGTGLLGLAVLFRRKRAVFRRVYRSFAARRSR